MRPRRVVILVALAAALSAGAVVVHAAPSVATVRPAMPAAAPRTVLKSAARTDPAANARADTIRACELDRVDTSTGCLLGALHQFDAALAKEGYRHARFQLPSDYRRLTPAQQLFVLTNEDRIARGESPVAGMDACLDRDARAAAARGADPDFACRDPFRTAGSNWSGANDPLWSEFMFVYDDGPGSGNTDCPRTGGGGCWGHRHNVLAAYGRPALMGAADSVAGGGEAEEFYGADTAHATFTWAQERRYFAHPITEQSLRAAMGVVASRR